MRKSRGFSLIETITSVSIIAIMGSLLVPVFQRVREGGKQVLCLNNQRQISIAVTMWAQDHDEDFPGAGAVWDVIEMPAKSLTCPSQGNPTTADTGQTPNDFAYSGFIAGKSLSLITHPAQEILVADAGQSAIHPAIGALPNIFLQREDIALRHDGGYIAGFCDGHVELRTELPPYWIAEVADAASFDKECLQSQYPVLAIFAQGGLAGPHTPPGYTNRALSISSYACADLARQHRGALKIVVIDSASAPELAASWQVGKDANGTYPGAAILLLAGAEHDRYVAHNPGCAESADIIQGMKSELGDKVDALISR